jgi:hypothetical protein
MRLALIYALVDQSGAIRLEHLKAALEVWRYADESARVIFGDALGNPTADRILSLLRGAESGLTRTELSDSFGRHATSSQITDALEMLERYGLAEKTSEATAGRPAERWKVRKKRDKRNRSEAAS